MLQRPKGCVDIWPYSFLNLGARGGVDEQRHTQATLPPGKTQYPRAGLDKYRKSRPPLGFDPGPSST